MKKRLIITSALMTAVLGASLATGTYAWYQASGNATIKAVSSDTVLTIPEASISTAGEFELTVTVTPLSAAALQLSEYNAGGYKYYAINKEGTSKLEYTGVEGAVASKAYSVTVQAKAQEVGGVSYTLAQVAEALNGQKVKVDVAIKTGSDDRMKFTAQTGALADGALFDGANTETFTSAALTTANLTDGIVVGYIGVRVDGDKGTGGLTPDTGTITADFTVTVRAEAAA